MAPEFLTRLVCPACGKPAAQSRILFSLPFLGAACSVRQCACGLVYKDRAPGSRALESMYSSNYVHFQPAADAGDRAAFLSFQQKLGRCRRLLAGPPPRGGWKLLDVGCGSGQFVAMAKELGYAAEGLDAFLPENLQSPNLHRGQLADLPAASFDIVTLLNVAEHVVEPAPLFQSVRRVLRPGGAMLLTCPFGGSLARRLHRGRWIHMALDEHLLFWTPPSLTGMLRPLGFSGPVSYRISGLPFPYGRTAISHDKKPSEPALWQDAQAGTWRAAREIQRHVWIANAFRALIDWTHTGDYLEYAIRI